MSYFLQKGEVLPFRNDPTIAEAGNILLFLFAVVFLLWIYKVLRSIPKQNDALDPESGIGVVSPFLIVENTRGDLSFSINRSRTIYKVVAIVLILIFTVVPLMTIAGDSSLANVLYY